MHKAGDDDDEDYLFAYLDEDSSKPEEKLIVHGGDDDEAFYNSSLHTLQLTKVIVFGPYLELALHCLLSQMKSILAQKWNYT